MKSFSALPALLIFLASCSAPQEKPDAEEKAKARVLADSLFPFKNISGTLISESRNINYHRLDSAEKMDLVAPIYLADLKQEMTADYFIHWQTAVFVSKQEKIGNFTPIIVSIGGDDFDALYYILLDEAQTPVSGIQIGGSGICGGPEEVSDSLLRLCPVRTSILKKDRISTSVVRMTFQPDSVKHPTLVDSIIYTSKVLPDGKIETRLKDSIRMQRIIY